MLINLGRPQGSTPGVVQREISHAIGPRSDISVLADIKRAIRAGEKIAHVSVHVLCSGQILLPGRANREKNEPSRMGNDKPDRRAERCRIVLEAHLRVVVRHFGQAIAPDQRRQPRRPQPDDGPMFRFLTALHHLDVPLIAAVQGAAIGIGATMLLQCDVIYAAPMTWHQMAAEALSGPSVRLAMGGYPLINMNNAGDAAR